MDFLCWNEEDSGLVPDAFQGWRLQMMKPRLILKMLIHWIWFWKEMRWTERNGSCW